MNLLSTMAFAHATWRAHPFEKRRNYLAKKSFDAFLSGRFVAGRQYVFLDVGYSHYDACSVFQFKEVGSPIELSWWWSEDDDDSECLERFEQVGQASGERLVSSRRSGQ
ncbi:MAG: hypothetical protein ABI330_12035 [Caldimonas sp.]